MRLLSFLEGKAGRRFKTERRSTEGAERMSKRLGREAEEMEEFTYEGLVMGFKRIMYGPGGRVIGLRGMIMRCWGLRRRVWGGAKDVWYGVVDVE